MEPVVIVADASLQEEPMPEPDRRSARIPKLTLPSPPAGDSAAVAEAARMLVAADNPVILAGRVARTPKGLDLLVELAETLQAPVQDRRFRMNFPSRHQLYGGGDIASADVILGLELANFWFATHKQTPVNCMGMENQSRTKPGAKLISIFSGDLFAKSNYQDFGRYTELDLAIAADSEATLPALIEACKRLITADRRTALEERGKKLAKAARQSRDRALADAALGLGRQPDQHGACVGRIVGPPATRRLVAGVGGRVLQSLADAPVGLPQTLSIYRTAKAPTASATALRRPSAPLWPIRSTVA